MSRRHRGQVKGDPVTYQLPGPAGGVQLETFVPWTLVKRGMKKQVITPIDVPQAFLAGDDAIVMHACSGFRGRAILSVSQ